MKTGVTAMVGEVSWATYWGGSPLLPINTLYLMNKEHFTKLLIEQQDRGKALLSLISNMPERNNDFGDCVALFVGEDLYYVPEDELVASDVFK